MIYRGATEEEAKRKVEIFRRMVMTKERVLAEVRAKKRKEEEEARAEEETETQSESESDHRKSPAVK